jgi:hypothetical protein
MKSTIKRFGIIALVAVIGFSMVALSLTGCGYDGDGSSKSVEAIAEDNGGLAESDGDLVESDGANYPYHVITVVSSENELKEYCKKHTAIYFGGKGNVVPDNNFLNATEKYSDNYFADNFLVIVEVFENSGGSKHKVEKIEENGDIIIKRWQGNICMLGSWSIIIELGNSSKVEQYRAVFVDTYPWW